MTEAQSISIHALLAESDVSRSAYYSPSPNFYPRSPCGERRGPQKTKMPSGSFLSTLSLRRATCGCFARCHCWGLFLSTLSLRRATERVNSMLTLIQNFYPRSPCGERPLILPPVDTSSVISIHALLAESDANGLAYTPPQEHHFYPRSPCGERRSNILKTS